MSQRCGRAVRLYSRKGLVNEPDSQCREKAMLKRLLGVLGVALMMAGGAAAQSKPAQAAEPVSDGRSLSEWVQDLKAPAPQSRNAAAYEIAGMPIPSPSESINLTVG